MGLCDRPLTTWAWASSSALQSWKAVLTHCCCPFGPRQATAEGGGHKESLKYVSASAASALRGPCNQTRKRKKKKKKHPHWKGRCKTVCFCGRHDPLCRKFVEFTEALWELIHKYSKWQDTRAIYKHQLYFYIGAMNNAKKKIKNTIPFTIASERIKHWGIHLTKETLHLHWKLWNTAEGN